jgi:hypothetical protein
MKTILKEIYGSFEMEFYLYLSLEDLNTHNTNNGIILPSTNDYSFENIENLVLKYIKDYEPNHLIEFSAWLNMIYSVNDIKTNVAFQNNLLLKTGWPTYADKVLIHRFNTLSLIGLAAKHIESLKGTISLSENSLEDCGKYVVALALLNCHRHNTHDFIRQLIRDFPNYYPSDFIKTIFYNRILKSYALISYKKNSIWMNLLLSFKKKTNINIKDIVKFTSLSWTYYFNKFDINRMGTFLIDDSKFDKSLPVIRKLSITVKELAEKLSPQDMELYKLPVETVRQPILSKGEGIRYPVDFVSIIDTNGALAYEIFEQCYFSSQTGNKRDQYRKFKDDIYWSISEDIFIEIIKEIFPDNFQETREKKGYPDCILQDDRSIILLEYTTAEPGFMSLFSENIQKVKNKYKNVLITRQNQKKSKAKLKQISDQIELIKKAHPNKKILPILVTDNHFGDFDLLNEMDNFLTSAIIDNKLQNLLQYKITILSMDDIFTIFRYEETNSFPNLVLKLNDWNSDLSIKKKYLFSFSSYVTSVCSGTSEKYKKFRDSALFFLGMK